MDLRELKIQFLNAKVVTDDIKVKFKTHNGYTYYNCNCHVEGYNNNNVLVIDLIDKSIPNFKVGDKITNISGLFPDVGYTIAEVNEEEQYYTYKEIHGRTYFKDQDKLMLVKADSSTTPVEDEPVSSIIDVFVARQNVQIYNDKYYIQINKINKFIDEISKQGVNHYEATFMDTVYHCDKTGKLIPLAELIDRINHHYTNLGFDVVVNKIKAGYKVSFKW